MGKALAEVAGKAKEGMEKTKVAEVAGKAKEGMLKAKDHTKSCMDSATKMALEQVRKQLDAACGDGASAAIDAICDMLGSMYGDLFPGSEYPLFMNVAMILRQALQEGRYKTPLLSGVPYSDADILKKAARYGLFANAAYKATADDVVSKVPGLRVDQIHHMEVGKGVGCPSFLIAEDSDMDVLVLAIRGTASVADALTDCLCEEVPFLNGHAHGSIAEHARQIMKIARPVLLELLEKSPEKKVIVTGHSLGAGAAVLLTVELFSKASEGSIHDPALVECFAFAPPPVFYPRKELPESPRILSFINNMDCIPRLCLGSGVKLLLAVKEVDGLSMGLPERLKFLTSPSDKPQLPDYLEIPDEFQSKFHSHHAAGTLICFSPAEDGSICCEELEPEMLDRLLLHKCMASDHSMKKYCNVLERMLPDEIQGKGRLPKQLERLPEKDLRDVVAALKALENAGLSEVESVKDLRLCIESCKVLKP